MKNYGYFKWDRVQHINRATPEEVIKALRVQPDEDVFFITLDNVPFQHYIGVTEEAIIARIEELKAEDAPPEPEV